MLEIVEKGLNYTDTTENALAIQESIYAQMLKELVAAGAYLCSAEEKAKLQKGMWDEKGALNREIVAQEYEVDPFTCFRCGSTGGRYMVMETEYPVESLAADARRILPDNAYRTVCFGMLTPQADPGKTSR